MTMWKANRGWKWSLGALVVGCLLCATVQSALANEPTPEERERAGEHFEDGAEYFFEERYGRALVEFRRAFRLNPHPMIAYNKALANLRLGNLAEAYRRAVQASEMGGLPLDEGVRNDARIRALAVALRAERVAADVQSSIEDGVRYEELLQTHRDELVSRAGLLARAVELKAGQIGADLLSDAPDDAPRQEMDVVAYDEPKGMGAWGWTGVVMTGIGAGLVGYAGVTNHRLGDKIDTYETASESGDRETYFRLRQDIENGQRNGQIALYTGAGVATIGAVLWLVAARSGSSSDSQMHLAPGLTPGSSPGGFIQLNGNF